MTTRTFVVFLTTATLLLSTTGCLKTRAQLREENVDHESAQQEGTPAPRTTSYQLEEIKAEIARLSGKIEELEHAQKTQNLGNLQDSLTGFDGRIKEIENNQMLIMSEVKALKDERTEQKAKKAEEATVRARPKDSLARANALLESKKYEDAAEEFRKIISANPGPKESSDANFGLGSALYGLKDYKKAIVAFSKVQELNPKSAKIPAALWLIGRGFEHLNMSREANGFYSELQERFPKSAEAKKARDRMKKPKGGAAE